MSYGVHMFPYLQAVEPTHEPENFSHSKLSSILRKEIIGQG